MQRRADAGPDRFGFVCQGQRQRPKGKACAVQLVDQGHHDPKRGGVQIEVVGQPAQKVQAGDVDLTKQGAGVAVQGNHDPGRNEAGQAVTGQARGDGKSVVSRQVWGHQTASARREARGSRYLVLRDSVRKSRKGASILAGTTIRTSTRWSSVPAPSGLATPRPRPRRVRPEPVPGGIVRLTGFAPPGPDRTTVEGGFDQPHGLPHYRYDGHVSDLTVPLGFWRSVGNSMNAFFLESFIDEMAHAAGADPLTFRRDLMADTHAPSAALLDKVAEMSGWDALKRPGFGRGVAFCYSFGTPVAEVVEVQDVEGRVRLTRAWIACDPGLAMDPGIIEAQMTGAMIYGLSAAVQGAITFEDQQAVETNFWDYDALRIHTTPSFEVAILQNNGAFGHIGGVGEPGTPPAAPALANALFDITGIHIAVQRFDAVRVDRDQHVAADFFGPGRPATDGAGVNRVVAGHEDADLAGAQSVLQRQRIFQRDVGFLEPGGALGMGGTGFVETGGPVGQAEAWVDADFHGDILRPGGGAGRNRSGPFPPSGAGPWAQRGDTGQSGRGPAVSRRVGKSLKMKGLRQGRTRIGGRGPGQCRDQGTGQQRHDLFQ